MISLLLIFLFNFIFDLLGVFQMESFLSFLWCGAAPTCPDDPVRARHPLALHKPGYLGSGDLLLGVTRLFQGPQIHFDNFVNMFLYQIKIRSSIEVEDKSQIWHIKLQLPLPWMNSSQSLCTSGVPKSYHHLEVKQLYSVTLH